MSPALTSASIAICLPGIASKVKRALTSEMRPAPLVTTTKLMITRMMNTTRPMVKLPPMTKAPKDSITCPAAPAPVWPLSSTTRVEATLSARRSRVASSSTEGKTAKSSGRNTYTLANSTTSESMILKVNSVSSKKVGSGTTSMASMIITISGAPRP
jgi:hypothetical protein